MLVTAAGTSLQARLNADLLAVLHNPAQVSLVNLTIGFVAACFIVVLSGARREAAREMFRSLRSGALRPWEMLGGLCGAYFVAIQGFVAGVIGVAAYTVAVVAGQTTSAALLDRWGIGPGGRQRLTWKRIVAVVVAIAAVILPMREHADLVSGFAIAVAALLALSAGVASSTQATLNGRVGALLGQPLVAAWANFGLGALVLLGVVATIAVSGGWQWAALPLDRPWLLFNGLFGLLYVAAAAWGVGSLGVLLTALVSVAGLLFGAVIADIVLPVAGISVSFPLVLGVVLSLAAAALAAFGRSQAGRPQRDGRIRTVGSP